MKSKYEKKNDIFYNFIEFVIKVKLLVFSKFKRQSVEHAKSWKDKICLTLIFTNTFQTKHFSIYKDGRRLMEITMMRDLIMTPTLSFFICQISFSMDMKQELSRKGTSFMFLLLISSSISHPHHTSDTLSFHQ